jgi:hypothetical protein
MLRKGNQKPKRRISKMKKFGFGLLALIIIVALAFGASVFAEDEAEPDDSTSDGIGVYACPMFCEHFLTTDSEARCPSCNMFVEELDALYHCTDDPDEVSITPEELCSDSEEPMVPVEEIWVCPMHPDEVYTNSDAACSICGMDLVLHWEADESEGSEGVDNDHHANENATSTGHQCGGG